MSFEEKKLALLKRLEEEFADYDDVEDCSIFDHEELKSDMDILRGIHTGFSSDLVGVLGEYLFMPIPSEDVLYFSVIYTITDLVPEFYVEELAATIARLNFALPFGAFVIGGEKDRTLAYKLTVPIMANLSEDQQFEEMMAAFDAAYFTADRMTGYLLLLIRGEATMAEVLELATDSGSEAEA